MNNDLLFFLVVLIWVPLLVRVVALVIRVMGPVIVEVSKAVWVIFVSLVKFVWWFLLVIFRVGRVRRLGQQIEVHWGFGRVERVEQVAPGIYLAYRGQRLRWVRIEDIEHQPVETLNNLPLVVRRKLGRLVQG